MLADLDFSLLEGTYGLGMDAYYSAFFPVFEIGAGFHNRASYFTDTVLLNDTFDLWRESYARFGVHIPLNFSRGVYSTMFEAGVNVSYTYITSKVYTGENETGDGSFIPLYYYVNFTNSKYGSFRDINPPIAQSVSIFRQHTPFKGDYLSDQISMSGDLYFPGLFKHHSFKLGAAYEYQEAQSYRFASAIYFPRGYNYVFFNEFLKLSADYTFPIASTHWNLGSVLNFKRFIGNMYYDYGWGKESSGKCHFYHSTGAGIYTIFNPFSMYMDLLVGIRGSWLVEEEELKFAPVLGLYF
jgi:hypothetical protein